jgi:putative effector of murein hydrolase
VSGKNNIPLWYLLLTYTIFLITQTIVYNKPKILIIPIVVYWVVLIF